MLWTDSESTDWNEKHPDLLDEFIKEISRFCEKRIEQLDVPAAVFTSQPENSSKEESEVFEPTTSASKAVKNDSLLQEEPEDLTDPLSFLLANKHLDSKRVEFISPMGKLTGQVRGLVSPFIRVESGDGKVWNIKPGDLKVLD